MDDQQSEIVRAITQGGAESWSAEILKQIFGPATGGGETLFSVAVGYLNIAVLTIGSLLFVYNLTAGVLQSAHEGEVLGKRWSSLWAPLRVIFALGLMIPVPGLGGYNTAQVGILHMVRGSTALASLMWSTSIPALLDGKVQIASTTPTVPTTFVAEIWAMMSCVALADYQLSAAGSSDRIAAVSNVRDSGQIVYVTQIGDRAETAGICGSVGTPPAPDYLSTADELDSRAKISQTFLKAHKAAIEALMRKVKVAVDDVLGASLTHDGRQVEVSSTLRDAIVEANAKLEPIGELIETIATSGDEGQKRLRSYIQSDDGQGWLGAGSYYLVLARLNNEVQSVISAAPVVLSPPRYAYEATGVTLDSAASGRWSGMFGSASAANLRLDEEEVLRIGSDFERALSRASAKLQSFGFGLPDPALAAALAPRHGEGGGIWDILADAVDNAGRQLSQTVAGYFSPSQFGNDPLIGVVAVGQMLITVAGVITAAIAVAGAIPLLGSGVGAAMTILGPLILGMTVIGASMSVLLPSMPYVLWILAIFSYFVSVAGAVVAAPLWAVAHMHLDGEGIAPPGVRQGYLLLLRLFLTPPLMILGMFAAMAIFRAVGGLISLGIYYLLSSFSGSPLQWLVSVVIMTGLATAMFLIVLERSFSLITTLPNTVMDWLGSNSHDAT